MPRVNPDRPDAGRCRFNDEGLVEDRACAPQALFHDPYYQRHLVGAPHVLRIDGETIHSEANDAVSRTKLSELTTVFNVGRYLDVVVRTSQGLRFASRLAIYDSEMIPNSIIYPI